MRRYRISDKSLAVAGFFSDLRKLRKFALASNRKKKINNYLNLHTAHKLQIGSGEGIIPGWLATDINPPSRDVLYLNATKTFPFSDGAFDYVCSEHMIEHISWDEGLFMLRECRRVLKVGGILRISTPDLAVLLKTYSGNGKLPTEKQYIRWIIDENLKELKIYKPSFVVNVAFRNWGHKFLYDGELLEIAMRTAGFGNIERVPVGESTHATLRGIERHGAVIRNEKISKFETMVFEATALDCTQPRWHPNHRVAHRRPEPSRAEIGPGRKWPHASVVPNRSLPYDHSEASGGRQAVIRPASRNGGRA